jgi:hypothetical protein
VSACAKPAPRRCRLALSGDVLSGFRASLSGPQFGFAEALNRECERGDGCEAGREDCVPDAGSVVSDEICGTAREACRQPGFDCREVAEE